jgi:linoleate 10R-lipoxygenase
MHDYPVLTVKDTLSLPQFLSGLAQWTQGLPVDPAQWDFGGLKRQSDGSFQDGELVDLLRIGTENVAGKSFRRVRQSFN